MSKDTKRLGLTYWANPNRIILKISKKYSYKLLELNLSAGLFDSLLKVLSLVLRQAFLNGSRSALNESLSVLQTETASLLNSLHDLQLGCANIGENHVERGLLLSSGGCTTSSGTSSNCNSCSGGLNAILVLQDLC